MFRQAALTLALSIVLSASLAAAADIEREFRFNTGDLTVSDLIGSVRVSAADGDEFVIRATIRGKDAADGVLKLSDEPDGGDDSFAVIFPLAEHDRYVYPALGHNSKTSFTYRQDNDEDHSWLRRLLSNIGGKQVTVQDRGRGLEIWADLDIAVPAGARLDLRLGVGTIVAANVAGDLRLDSHTGTVEVRGVTGDVLVDTGSGDVVVAEVTGDLSVDTGSGDVELSGCDGRDLLVDTGSGSVSLANCKTRDLRIDTGSGGVEAFGIEAEKALIDTGSGSVRLGLNWLGRGGLVVDTGSGGIDVDLPADLSARVEADCGSGTITVDCPGAKITRQERNELTMNLGDGETRVLLDAGSGSIHVQTN